MATDPPSAPASIDAIASLTLLTVDEIRACVKSGHIPKPDAGRYRLTETIKGAFRWRKEEAIKPWTVNKDELRNMTGLSDQRHRQLANEGHFPAPIKGRYNVIAAATGVIRYLREKHQDAKQRINDKRERRLDDDHALAAITLAERNKQLVSLEDMDSRLRPLLVSVRQSILNSSLTDDERDQMLTDFGSMLEHALTRNLKGSPSDPAAKVAPDLDQAAAPEGDGLGG